MSATRLIANLGTITADTFMSIAGGPTTDTTEANRQIPINVAGTLASLAVTKTQGNRTGMAVTSRLNGGNGTLTVAMTNTNGLYEDTSHSDAVAVGDLVAWNAIAGTGGTLDLIVLVVAVSYSTAGQPAVNILAQNVLSITSAVTTAYCTMNGNGSPTATQADAEWQVKMPSGLVAIRNLYVKVSANTSDRNIVLTVNGATAGGTTPTVTIPASSGATTLTDTANSINAQDADLLSFKFVRAAGGAGTCAIEVIAIEVMSLAGVYHLVLGGSQILSSGTFLSIGGSGYLSGETDVAVPLRGTGTLSRLAVYVNSSGGLSMTVRKNVSGIGSPTNISVALDATGWKLDTSNTYNMAGTELMSFNIGGAGSAGILCAALTFQPLRRWLL